MNEIYRDLANIVEQQQEAVEQIGTNTEGAHARAQEGLIQVGRITWRSCAGVHLFRGLLAMCCLDGCTKLQPS